METLSRNPLDPGRAPENEITRLRSVADDVDHAVAWSAIIAGAAAAAALSLILLMLGTGLGLSSVSPWTRAGIGSGALGVAAIVWLTLTQLLASGMGGYIAGRLGAQWVDIHADEAYFRDTAHGFLAWAVASLATAALLTTTIGSIVGTGVKATASVAAVATTAATGATMARQRTNDQSTEPPSAGAGVIGYLVDTLFRKDMTVTTAPGAGAGAADTERSAAQLAPEATRIFANAVDSNALMPDDVKYLGQLISQRTGVPQADAEKRVTTAYARLQAKLLDAEVAARDAAEKVRKASAYTALWLFISLLTGAFFAALAATYGGRQRRALPRKLN